jgi:hypothetical protein
MICKKEKIYKAVTVNRKPTPLTEELIPAVLKA